MDGSPNKKECALAASDRSVYWYVSRRCNLACKHCWLNCSPDVDTSKELSTREALEAITKIKEFASRVSLTGGEALLRPDFLEMLAALIASYITPVIETNGLLISDRFVELLRRAKDLGLKPAVAISLDGGTKEAHEYVRGANTFERTLAGMRMLKDADLDFEAQCILHRRNAGTIKALFEQMAQFYPRVSQLKFGFLNPVGRGLQLEEDWGMTAAEREELYEAILDGLSWYPGNIHLKVPPALIPPQYFVRLSPFRSQWRCNASCSFPILGILPDGRITLCALTGDDPSLCFGNIRTDSLTRIWDELGMDSVRQKYVEAKLSGICGDCIFCSLCKGSCRAYAYEELGQFNAPFPLCESLDRRGEFPRGYRISRVAKRTAQDATRTVSGELLRQYFA